MSEIFLIRALDLPFESFYLTLALCTLRTLGFFYGFIAFGWGLGTNTTLKVGLSFLLSLPVMVAMAHDVDELIFRTSPLLLALIAVKEFGVGFGLGLLGSSPFRSLSYAGEIIDVFRGENNGGITAPDGGQLTTLANFYLIIGVYVFVSIGGFMPVINIVYATYAIWPIDHELPRLMERSAEIVSFGIGSALRIALVICAPLMILMVAVEFVLIVSAKLGRRFGLYNMSFTMKNLIMVLSLPILAMTIVHLTEDHSQNVLSALPTLTMMLE